MKMYYWLFLLLIGACHSVLAQQTYPSVSLNPPPAEVALFGEKLLSTSINERDFALSPNGNEIYFTISTPQSTFQTIVFCKKINEEQWTSPMIVSFAGQYSDLEPTFSADGKTMYFASNRPLSGNTPKDFDIWKVERTDEVWGKPVNLGAPINTSENEFYPSVTKNNDLYFTAAYAEGNIGNEDIYKSSFVNNVYQKPVALDTAVNSKFYEFNAFISPDEKFILFSSYGRKDDTGGGDLYISQKDSNNKWQPAKNLKYINSAQLDYCPFVSQDGKSLFFTSERHKLPVSFRDVKATYQNIVDIATRTQNGTGNIYWMDFQKLLTLIK